MSLRNEYSQTEPNNNATQASLTTVEKKVLHIFYFFSATNIFNHTYILILMMVREREMIVESLCGRQRSI